MRTQGPIEACDEQAGSDPANPSIKDACPSMPNAVSMRCIANHTVRVKAWIPVMYRPIIKL